MFNLYANNILQSRPCLARIISRLGSTTVATTCFAQDLTLTNKAVDHSAQIKFKLVHRHC